MNDKRLTEQFQLRSRLRFNIETGHIWLDENRMLLLHAKALGALRRELFDKLGTRRAQGMMLRMGFVSGQHDAELALKLADAGEPFEVLLLGPELHAIEGSVKAIMTESKVDWEQGSFTGKVDWQHSWEAESHIKHFGLGEEPACWSLVGYASGYMSRFLRRFIVFRETQCIRQGHACCKIEGRPVEDWEEDGYIDYFRVDPIDDKILELQEELTQLRGGTKLVPPAHGQLVGSSPAFKAAFELLHRAADSSISVLLLGETGVGKEMFARWLHDNGPRAQQPFVAINCAAIPHDLIEAELFGVRKGAFTGALDSRPGRFERADGGTLFLDEVGDLSPSAQVKLLRALQSGEIERLGDVQPRKVNVRIVAATNVDLHAAIKKGQFRADLYYRLATYPVAIPPLRERKSDIPLLAAALIDKYQASYGKQRLELSGRALQALVAHRWPGNVRELENYIERAVLLAPSSGQIEVHHLFSGSVSAPALDEGVELDSTGSIGNPEQAEHSRLCDLLIGDGFDLERHERCLIERAVALSHGNLTHAARRLGITRRQLAYRLKQNAPRE